MKRLQQYIIFSFLLTFLVQPIFVFAEELGSSGNPIYLLSDIAGYRSQKNEDDIRKLVKKELSIEHSDRSFIVKYKKGTTKDDIKKVKKSISHRENSNAEMYQVQINGYIYELIANTENSLEQAMVNFGMHDNVENIFTNKLIKKSWVNSNNKSYPNEGLQSAFEESGKYWNLGQVNMPSVWDMQDCQNNGQTCGGNSEIVVAVIDDGLSFENYSAKALDSYGDPYEILFGKNPELSTIKLWNNPGEYNTPTGDNDGNGFCDDVHGADIGQYFANYFSGVSNSMSSECTDPDPFIQGSLEKTGHPNTEEGHGDLVTNVIAANLNDGAGTGLGIAPNVSIMPIKVFDPITDYSDSFNVLFGIMYALDPNNDGNYDDAADVINISLGMSTPDEYIQEVVYLAKNNNIVVVAASGNDGANQLSYPAGYANVIAVGSSAPSDVRASYSNWGDKIDILAPVGNLPISGNSIYVSTFSCFPDCTSSSDFTSFAGQFVLGTSFAAPQVSATIALLKSKNPNLSNSDIENILYSTSRDILAAGWDAESGYGILDIKAALLNVWQPWLSNGGSRTKVSMSKYGDKIVQAVRGNDGLVYTRYSIDGVNWQPWALNGGSAGYVTMVEHSGKLFQSIRDSSNLVWTRYSTGTTVPITGGSALLWEPWIKNGGSSNDISMVSYSGKLYQSVRGNDGLVYTRSSVDGINWDSWVKNGGSAGAISMTTFGSKLFQSVRDNSNLVWTRYTTDGTSWNQWILNGGSSKDITLIEYSSSLFQSVRGNDGLVYTRNTADGVTWSSWVLNGGSAGNISMEVFDGRLYQSVRDVNNLVWTRYTEDGITWKSWIKNGGTSRDIALAAFGNKLLQAVSGNDDLIYTRHYTD